jgi:tetratricopeptide (TPR) repeat protein
VGHGTFDPRENTSSLLFCDKTGKAREISDLHLGPLFTGYPEMRLVLLNACEAARPHPKDPFAGVAAGLVKRGVPAVIGMQFDISDEAAIILSSEFYQALVDGLPVDAALTQARQAVFFMPNYVEWATPVLFMRAPDGRIFDLTEADLTSTASSARAGRRPRDLTKELEALYTEGLAAYFTERWDTAVERFNRVAQLDPAYRDVVLKLEKATKQNQLAELYTQGSKAFESQSWPDAVESFEAILDMDAGYKDAAERLEEARRHRTISGLYQDAVQLHGAGQYQAVVRAIDQIHQLDPDFVDPEDLLGSAREGLVRQEQQSKVAELQSQALQRMDERDWLGAKEILEEIREVEPDNAQREALLARVENELDPTQHGEIEPIEPEDAEAPEPGFSITLSVKPRELQTGEEAKWTATVENDGDTDLFDMTIKQGRKRLGKPFGLAPGEKKQRTFTNSYDTPGQKSKTVSARALDPDGEPVEAKVRLRVEVYEPAEPEPSPPPDQTASLPSGKDEKRGDGMLRGRRTYPRTAADVIGRRQYELPDRTNLLRRSTQDRWTADLSLARRRRPKDTEPDPLVQKIRDLLDETASDYDDFFVDPDIPEKKKSNARSKCEVPWGERILGLIDFTAWGSAKDSLVFGEKGIYYHNGWLSSDRGAGSLRYAKFPKRKFKELFDDDGEPWEDVSLGKGQIIDTAASDVPASVLTDLLKRIRKLVKKAKT